MHSELREVLLCIKYSKEKEKLKKLLRDEPGFKRMSHDAAKLLKAMTGMKIKYPKDKEDVNMCQAIEEMLQDARNEGRAEMSNAIEGMLQDARNEVRAEMDGKMQDAVSSAETNTLFGSIRNLMKTMHITAAEAMDALLVPMEQREKLAAML